MNRALTKADIVEAIYEKTDRNRADVKNTVEILLGLMKQAIRDDNPVIVFEHKLLYGGKRKEAGQLNAMCEVPDEEYTIPFGKAAIRREGKDVTIVANMLMWYKAMEAADILEKEGISCEIIDPRTLVPFDYETVLNSIAKTGKLPVPNFSAISVA